jgi:hypothetical protein
MQKLEIKDTLRGAFVDLLDNAGALFLGALILTVAVSGFSSLVFAFTPRLDGLSEGAQVAMVLGSIVLILGVWSFFYLGLIGMGAQIQRGSKPKLEQLFKQGSRIMPGWIAGTFVNAALFGLPVAAIVVFGQSEVGALLVGCGMLIWFPLAYAATCLTMFFVVDRKQPAFTAIYSSLRATSGNLPRIFATLIVAGLIGTLFSFVPLVGSLASLCFQVLVISRIYTQLGASAKPL